MQKMGAPFRIFPSLHYLVDNGGGSTIKKKEGGNCNIILPFYCILSKVSSFTGCAMLINEYAEKGSTFQY